MVTTCSQTEPVDAGRGEPIIRQLKFTRIVWHQITHGILESHRQRHLVEGSRCVFLSEPHRNEIELLVTEAVDIFCLQEDPVVYLLDHLPFCEDVLDVTGVSPRSEKPQSAWSTASRPVSHVTAGAKHHR